MRLPWIISDERFAFQEGYKMIKPAAALAASAVITHRADNKGDTTVRVPITAGWRSPAGSSRSPTLIAYADNPAPSIWEGLCFAFVQLDFAQSWG